MILGALIRAQSKQKTCLIIIYYNLSLKDEIHVLENKLFNFDIFWNSFLECKQKGGSCFINSLKLTGWSRTLFYSKNKFAPTSGDAENAHHANNRRIDGQLERLKLLEDNSGHR